MWVTQLRCWTCPAMTTPAPQISLWISVHLHALWGQSLHVYGTNNLGCNFSLHQQIISINGADSTLSILSDWFSALTGYMLSVFAPDPVAERRGSEYFLVDIVNSMLCLGKLRAKKAAADGMMPHGVFNHQMPNPAKFMDPWIHQRHSSLQTHKEMIVCKAVLVTANSSTVLTHAHAASAHLLFFPTGFVRT